MNDAEQYWESYNQQIAALVEKYIGRQEMDRMLAMPDTRHKREWYARNIKYLMESVGISKERQRKCKYNSEKYKRYETTERESELLVDNLFLDLFDLSPTVPR